jgi:hypothetical protein
MPKWPKRKSFWVLLRREPVAIETQSGRARSFRAGYWIENLGWSPRDRKAPITRKGLIEMPTKALKKKKPRGWMNVWRGLFRSLLSNMTGM